MKISESVCDFFKLISVQFISKSFMFVVEKSNIFFTKSHISFTVNKETTTEVSFKPGLVQLYKTTGVNIHVPYDGTHCVQPDGFGRSVFSCSGSDGSDCSDLLDSVSLDEVQMAEIQSKHK